MSPQALSRLRAVRDCGVLRAWMGDPGLTELSTHHLVERRYPQGVPTKCDFRLSPMGQIVAKALPPTP